MIGTISSYWLFGGLVSVLALKAGLSIQAKQALTHDYFDKELNFDFIHDDNKTVVTKTKDYLRIYKVGGISYDTMTSQAHEDKIKQISNVINLLGKNGISFYSFGVKTKGDDITNDDYPNAMLQEIGDKETDIFRLSYDLHWYIVLVGKNYYQLDKSSNSFVSLMSSFDTTALLRPDNRDDICPLTCFLNYIVTSNLSFDLKAQSNNISGNIRGCDISFSQDNDIITYTPDQYYHRIMTVSKFADGVWSDMIGKILKLHAEIEYCMIAKPFAKSVAMAQSIDAKIQQYGRKWTRNQSLQDQYMAVFDNLNSEDCCFFETQTQFTIRAKTKDELDKVCVQISDIVSKEGHLINSENFADVVAYFNRFPDNKHNKLLRPLKLFNPEMAILLPFFNSPKGEKQSPFYDGAVRMFFTPSGQTYHHQFHAYNHPEAPAHTLLFGQTGSGKTLLQMYLLSGLAKMPGVRSYIFDSLEGCRFMVEAMGGNYMNYQKLALNPFDIEYSNEEERLNAMQDLRVTLRAMAGNMAGNGDYDNLENELNHVIDIAMNMERGRKRTLNHFFNHAFQDQKLRDHFANWVQLDEDEDAGVYAHIFNAEYDGLSNTLASSFMTGINMDKALSDEFLAPAIVSHITAAIDRAAKKHQGGYHIFIDEGKKLISNKAFQDYIGRIFLEHRKMRGAATIAFQEPSALLDADVGSSLINSATNIIFYPDPKAEEEIYKVPFNLNDEEFDFIKNSHRYGNDRRVLFMKRSQVGTQSVVLNVDLSIFGNAFRYFDSGTEANKRLIELQERHGDKWQNHL